MKKIGLRKSLIDGRGLVAMEAISRGEKIAFIKGNLVLIKDFRKLPSRLRKKSENWIGYSKYLYIDTKDSLFRYINHSCDPSAYIATPRTVIALKDIKVGDEITIDYSLSDAGNDGWNIANCRCKSKNCRGKIEVIQKLPYNIFKSNIKYITKKFQKVYLSHFSRSKNFHI